MPQHFQQLASRFETLIQSTVACASPFPWGILRFEYDRSSLVNGLVRVLHVEAILRDGLYVKTGSDTGIDQEINLKPFADQARSTPLTVYLVVPAQQSLSTRGDLARYASFEGGLTVDETTGEDGIPIPRLRPRVSLWAGDAPPSRFESVPLLRVLAQGDAFQVTDYIEPCLMVTPDSTLGRYCGETLGAVRTKSYLLADQLRDDTSQLDGGERFELQMKVRALAMGLPAAEAALQCGRVHPFTLYLLMCEMAGSVASIVQARVAPQFRVYQHTELLDSFQPVLAFIRTAVSEAAVESWIALPFRSVEGRLEVGPNQQLDELLEREQSLKAPAAVLELRAAPGVSEDAVWRWGEGCVIGSASFIPVFLSNRVSGAERQRADRVAGLIPHRGTVLLPILVNSSVAQPGEALQLVERFTKEGRPREAVLFVRRSETVQKG